MGNIRKRFYKYMIILGSLCIAFGVYIFCMGVISIARDNYYPRPRLAVFNLKLWFTLLVNPYIWGGFWVSIGLQSHRIGNHSFARGLGKWLV